MAAAFVSSRSAAGCVSSPTGGPVFVGPSMVGGVGGGVAGGLRSACDCRARFGRGGRQRDFRRFDRAGAGRFTVVGRAGSPAWSGCVGRVGAGGRRDRGASWATVTWRGPCLWLAQRRVGRRGGAEREDGGQREDRRRRAPAGRARRQAAGAPAPHCRHQSWPASIGAPQLAQARCSAASGAPGGDCGSAPGCPDGACSASGADLRSASKVATDPEF